MKTHYYDYQIEQTQPIDLPKLRVAIDKLPFASAIGGVGMNRMISLLRIASVQELDEEQEALLAEVVQSHGTLPDEEDAEESVEEIVYDGPAVKHVGSGYEFLPSKVKPQPLPPPEPEQEAVPQVSEEAAPEEVE